MNATDDLFKLIKSMNKSEKRYFKLFSSAQKENKNNLLLFDTIEKQEVYDEEKLKKKFGKNESFNQFAVTKTRLYNLILKSLSAYHSKRTIDIQIRKSLNKVEILYFKGLFNQCLKIIEKEKKTCYTFQKYSLLLDLIRWERKIRSFDIDNLQAVNLSSKEATSVLSKLSGLNAYQSISLSEWMLSNEKGRLREDADKRKFQTIISNPLLQKEPATIGWEAQWHYWFTYFTHYKIMGDYHKAYIAAKKSLDIFDTIPGLIGEEVHKYISSLSNIAIALQEMTNVNECIFYTNKLRSFIKSPALSFYSTLHRRAYFLSYMIELDLYVKSRNIEAATKVIPHIEKHFGTYSTEFSEYFKVGIYLEIANVFFISGDLKKSLFWLNKTLNGLNDRLDLQPAARLMNIVINYELNNIYTLDALITSTHHFLKRNKKLYPYEKNILNELKKFQFSTDKKTERKILQEMKDCVKKILMDEYGKIALEYFDLTAWIESKLEHRPILEIIKRTK